jgi:hypothetical protein
MMICVLAQVTAIGFVLYVGTYFWDSDGMAFVKISPACGPGEPGFNVAVNANGFSPNSNIDWKLVNSEGLIPIYGYYQTNDTGGFSDLVFAGAVKNDHYKLYIGDDANNDKKFDNKGDNKGVIMYANLEIPCS